MKIITRIDDVGYSDVYNIGTFETIERGIATHADIMLDTPGTEDALIRLREFPWISLGWHTHFWGSPVLDPKDVPSLVISENGRIRFRKDLHTAEDVVFDEAVTECRAQIDRCLRISGRAPDTGGAHGNSTFALALKQVCDEYNIARDYTKSKQTNSFSKLSEKWASRNIYMSDQSRDFKFLMSTDSITELDQYNPHGDICSDPKHLDYGKDDYVIFVWHPGFMDYYCYRLGDPSPMTRNFVLLRMLDVESLCSSELKNWIRDNRLELSNLHDALFGTRQYQNHLKAIGSELTV